MQRACPRHVDKHIQWNRIASGGRKLDFFILFIYFEIWEGKGEYS